MPILSKSKIMAGLQCPKRLYLEVHHPELLDYIQNHPGVWNNLKSQGAGYYDQRFNDFLSKHPRSAAELRANPELIYDPRFRAQHPELNDFLKSHPNVWRSVKNNYAGNMGNVPMPNRGWGAYDHQHQWRDYSWWHEHDRNWFWKNHPEWAAKNPDWRDNDGDWDDHHEWHNRDWWKQNCNTIVFVTGGYYFLNASYWYPAWGYDPSNSYYDYDGPIYTYGNLLPDQVIANVQRALQEAGYYTGPLTGSLNPATRAAIANFQRDYGLIITGAIDEPTVQSLELN
jgi:hypothetical protein